MRSTTLAAIAVASLYALTTINVATVAAATINDANVILIASKRGARGHEEAANHACSGEYKYYEPKTHQCANARDKISEQVKVGGS